MTDIKNLIGLSTRDILKEITKTNVNVAKIFVRGYNYIPFKISDETILPIGREDFIKDKTLDNFIENLKEDWNVSAGSLIEFENGEKGHIPMLDLAPRKSPEALGKVTSRLKEILVPEFGGGVILETGKSYQFIGFNPFSEKLLNQFLGTALITSIVTKMPDEVPNIHEQIVDYRYVGYSLIRGTTGLRITARGDKEFLPRVIAVI